MGHPNISHANKNQSRKAAAAAAKLNQKGKKMEIKHIILLSRKNKGEDVQVTEVQFYDFSPDEHAKRLKPDGEDNGIWFLTRRIPRGSTNARRTAGDGTWVQKHKVIPIEHDGEEIASRRYYVFQGESVKTVWRLYEYEELINTQHNRSEDTLKDDYVVCKLYKNKKSEGGSNNINGKRKCSNNNSSSSNQQKKEWPANQNPGSTSQTSKENESLNYSKFPARLGIGDTDSPAAGASDNTVPHFEFIRPDEDYNKLNENQSWINEFYEALNCLGNE